MNGLKKCPCCGRSAEIKESEYLAAVYVMCKHCFLSSRNAFYKPSHGYPCFLTKEKAENYVAYIWNRRVKRTKVGRDIGTLREGRIFKCSECGYGVEDIFLTNEHDYPLYFNHCPNCGARMEEDE